MLMNLRKKMTNQKGFTLIELLVVIAIIGVLAAIVVPKFSDSTARANTAKIAADLRTIDSAVAMHQAALGTDPADIPALVTAGYLAAAPALPTGSYLLTGGTPQAIGTMTYGLTGTGSGMRAHFGAVTNTSDFFK